MEIIGQSSQPGWNVKIKHFGVSYDLGYYENLEDAIKTRKDAEIKFGFMSNHGERIART